MILHPGDLVLTRSERPIPRLIRWATREGGEREPTLVNHVAMVSVGGPALGARVIQAIFSGVEEVGFIETFGPGPWPFLAIYRHRDSAGRGLLREIAWAREQLGDGYSIASLCLLFADSLAGKLIKRRVTLLSRLCRVTPLWYCSELIASIKRKSYGETFGRPSPATTTPDDIADWVQAHPDEWACVLPLGTR
jgi:hypothetical protein